MEEKFINANKPKTKSRKSKKDKYLEQTVMYEKKIYDLKQLVEIGLAFSSTLNFNNLLESIIYMSMAQMHVMGGEIFVRDFITNEYLTLETSKDMVASKEVIKIYTNSDFAKKLLEIHEPISFDELKKSVSSCEELHIVEQLSPSLIVPLVDNSRLNGILILQERIVIENDSSYSEDEIGQMKSIAKLASVAITNASLLEISSTDMMTQLKLKYYFLNMLSDSLIAAQELKNNISVLMFDIDFFKKFNDTYGHECGDFVLITVASLIKNSLREYDIAGRYGGEEFTVLLEGASKEEALLVAERIRETIQNHDFVYNDQHLHVTISGGISVFDIDTNPVSNPNEFINQADKGLYLSKGNGRNQVTFFDPNN
jgi:diguanylate cyclase (GGDEF)-like protein